MVIKLVESALSSCMKLTIKPVDTPVNIIIIYKALIVFVFERGLLGSGCVELQLQLSKRKVGKL